MAKPYRELALSYDATHDETLFAQMATIDPPATDEEVAYLLVMIGWSLRRNGMPHCRDRQDMLAVAIDQARRAVQSARAMH